MQLEATDRSGKVVNHFRTPKKSIGSLDADAAAKLVAGAGDIALVLDAKGVIKDLAFSDGQFAKDGFDEWLGKRLIDTVTPETKGKVEEMLRDAGSTKPRARQVNHSTARGEDIPIQYVAVAVGDGSRIVAVGRDLRTLAGLQRRLVDVQQSMEREYSRVRNSETRYRLLFQITSEPVLVVDGQSQLILEANPAASRLFGKAQKRLAGRSFPEIFDGDGDKAAIAHLASVRATGRTEVIELKLAETKRDVQVSASAFRQDGALHFLVRVIAKDSAPAPGSRLRLVEVIEKLPDGFVVTDLESRVLSANAAFLELIQATSEQQIIGQPLSNWLGRHANELGVLVSSLRERGSVSNFYTLARGEIQTNEEVVLSGVAVLGGEQPCLGFTVRSVGRRPDIIVNGRRDVPRSVDQLTQLVGRVALKDLVRESTDVIERLCIEAALELTGDNRASAADMLGLSRQSLYSKLRRHGLGDLDGDYGG